MHSDAARKAKLYEIKVKGHLGPHRFRSFEKLTITMEAGGESTIGCAAAVGTMPGMHRRRDRCAGESAPVR